MKKIDSKLPAIPSSPTTNALGSFTPKQNIMKSKLLRSKSLLLSLVLLLMMSGMASAQITMVASSSSTGATQALPAGWQANDLAIVFGINIGYVPLLPTGYTTIAIKSATGGTATQGRLAYRVLQAGDGSINFTGATGTEIIVLRGVDISNPIGDFASNGANSTTMNYAAISGSTLSSSWITGFGGHRTATDVYTSAVTGMTTQSFSGTGFKNNLGMHSITGTTSFTARDWPTVNQSANWVTIVVEVKAAAPLPTPIFSITPTSHDFGNVITGNSSPQTFTITNTGSGTLDITAGGITLTGTNADQFILSAVTYPISLASGISTTVDVAFEPTTAGSKTANLEIVHNAAGSPSTVALTGAGIPPPEYTYGNYNLTGIWSDAINWTPGLPTATSNVYIKEDIILDVDATVNDLGMLFGKKLTISFNKSLTVNGTLTKCPNAEFLVIKSTADGTGSLIFNAAPPEGVAATVERYLTKYDFVPDQKFHFISSPVAAQLISPEFLDFQYTYDELITDFYSFSETANLWINTRKGWGTEYNEPNPSFYQPGPNYNGPNFLVGKGYMVAYPAAEGVDGVTKNFTGLLNYAPETFTCTNTTGKGEGWNLLGNPFPSAVDWSKVVRGDGIDNALYYYDNATQQYMYYIQLGGFGVGGGKQFIPSMQGFMVHANTTGTQKTVTIPLAARTHVGQDVFFKSTNATPGSFSLKVAANGFEDEAFIHFNSGATTAFDGKYDAYKLRSYNDKVPTIFTKGSDDYELAINGLPELEASTVIPVYLEAATEGEHTLIAKLEGLPNAIVNLIDIKLNKTQNLTENPVYSFIASNDDDTNRFKLTFSTVGIDNLEAMDDAKVYAFDNILYVETTTKEAATVNVYNLTGQLVMQAKTGGNTLSTFNASELGSGVYMVNVILNQGVVSRKVVIRK